MQSIFRSDERNICQAKRALEVSSIRIYLGSSGNSFETELVTTKENIFAK